MTLSHEFSKRFYQWAIADARKEAIEDFARIRKVLSRSASTFLAIAQSMGSDERTLFLTALCKRFHEEGLLASQDSISSTDRTYIQFFLESESSREHRRTNSIDRSALRKILAQELQTTFPAEAKKDRQKEFFLTRRFGKFNIRTEFDTSSRHRELSYFHNVFGPGDTILCRGTSLLRWLGITGMTEWKLNDESESANAVNSAIASCVYFYKGVDELLQGIES
jgi:hypothetical protein